MATKTITNLATTIDALGAIKAEIAALTLKEKALKDNLAGLAAGAYEGDLFRLAISETVRCTLDMDAVREKLSPQFIAAHTNETPVRTLKVSARTGKGVA